MSPRAAQIAMLERPAGPRLRCFLSAALLSILVIGACGAKTAHAAPCAAPPDLKLSRIHGMAYGPSGLPVPEILVWVEQDGKSIAKTQTDKRGKFELKAAPGKMIVHVQLLGSRLMDLNVQVGHGAGGPFRSARLLMVLGLSGTRCSFVTMSKKEFKEAIKRYQGLLKENRH